MKHAAAIAMDAPDYASWIPLVLGSKHLRGVVEEILQTHTASDDQGIKQGPHQNESCTTKD
jgi:hypothetical protein